MALFYDLAIEKGFKIPTPPERRGRALRDLIRKGQTPIALFINDAHDNVKTLIGLKRQSNRISLRNPRRFSSGPKSIVLLLLTLCVANWVRRTPAEHFAGCK